MKRFSYTKVSFALVAASIAIVGMFRDPDMASADEISEDPVPNERMPGYQSIPDNQKTELVGGAELAKLNASLQDPLPTF